MPGWKVPGYVVEGLLGRGGSAEVWRGRVACSGDPVALKRIVLDELDALAVVRSEAALLATLDHPNLVRLHEFVTTADAAVLVLDLAAGGSLADLIQARGRLTPGEAITALAPVAAALAHAHGASVVHGDISAANVLFTDAGLPLLSDLGVARLLGDQRAVHCTPAYVEPSVAAGAPPTQPSDVFTLGGVLLHALTGSPTWPDASADAALERARRNDAPDAAQRLAAAEVPEATAAVVLRALDPDPHRRGSAAEFALDLRHSGRPVPVELAAGRPRPVLATGPRHAASSAPQSSGRARGVVLAAGRPDFERPSALNTSALAQLPQTRMVGPRPRPVLPRRPDRRRLRRRASWAAAVAALVASLAAGLFLWSPWQQRADAHASGDGEAPGILRPAASARSVAPRGEDWLAALRALDARRAQAFAQRSPALLAQVYADPALLRQDTAALHALVPAGCVLRGARTSYTAAHTTVRDAGHAVVAASALLAPSELTCPGRPPTHLAGAGPTRLRIELVRTAHGVRIAGQRVV